MVAVRGAIRGALPRTDQLTNLRQPPPTAEVAVRPTQVSRRQGGEEHRDGRVPSMDGGASSSMDDGEGAPRILFLGNPWPHASHRDLAARVGSTIGIGMASRRGRRLLQGLVLGWKLARNHEWDALLAEGPCVEVFTLRWFDRSRRKLVRLDGMNAARRSARGGDRRGPIRWIAVLELRQWDTIVVLNPGHEQDVRSLARKRPSTALWTPGVTIGDPFGGVVSSQQGPGVALMVGGRKYRIKYKGLDRVAVFSRQIQDQGMDPVTVYGSWADRFVRRFSGDVRFAGHRPAAEALEGAGFLIHLSRMDAFALAPIEAMVAGVPPLVSRDGAGCAPIIEEVEPKLLVSGVPEAIESMLWLRSLPPPDYSELCIRLRERGLQYVEATEEDDHVAEVRQALTGVVDRPSTTTSA